MASGWTICSTVSARKPGTMAKSSSQATFTRVRKWGAAAMSSRMALTMRASLNMMRRRGMACNSSRRVIEPTRVTLTITSSKARAN